MSPYSVNLRVVLLLAGLLAAASASAQMPTPPPCLATPHGPSLAAGPVTCSCSTEAAGSGTVWGTDIYSDDSAICRAALHAGVIPARGGVVTILRAPGQASYRGMTRNGVESEAYGAWQGSFRFARPGELTAEQIAASAARCPATAPSDEPGLQTLTCTCPAQSGTPAGGIWGTLVYTTDSALCAAALHAGAIDRRGGQVTIIMMPGRRVYRGGTRNGITSQAYGEWPSSFRFAGVAPPDPSLCPDTLPEREDNQDGPLSCTCPAEQTLRGVIWGTGTYTADSAICLAAVHAGAITRAGGRVTVMPAPGEPTYAGSTRNGVRAQAYEDVWDASIRFEGVAVPAPATPVQSPVAHTLRTLGQVSLYIQFRTNLAELDPPALPVLNELRDALRADPGLRLAIVGHTDNTGTAANNRPLSQRRAEAVRAWLVAQGIEAARLRAEGRGPDQPVADNATEAGRSLNRRVQVVRLE
jgi:outer membrane protein OmpA-like peptidoglycan-associated protein